jgi:hypothetical protein
LKSSGTLIGSPRGEAVAAIVEAHDLFDSLDADIELPVELGERFGVVPAMRGQRLAVPGEHGRHLGVGDAGGLAVAIDDAAAQPEAVVGERQEMGAVRLHAQGGNAPEGPILGGQHQSAAEFQCAETDARGIAVVEGFDRRRRNRDARDRSAGTRRLGQRERADDQDQRGDQRAGGEPAAGNRPQSTRLRRTGRGRSTAAFSSNSSASLSVMAPPSSSASTMVTARR